VVQRNSLGISYNYLSSYGSSLIVLFLLAFRPLYCRLIPARPVRSDANFGAFQRPHRKTHTNCRISRLCFPLTTSTTKVAHLVSQLGSDAVGHAKPAAFVFFNQRSALAVQPSQ